MHWILVLYLAAMNTVNFALMLVDKRRAETGRWRIRERTFFLLALLGGSLGGVLGMLLAHHKTRKWYFRYGLPLILIAQILLTIWICRS